MNIALIKRPRAQILLISLFLFPLMLWQTAVWTRKVAVAQIQERAAQTLDLYRLQVRSELDKFELLPQILATHPAFIQALSDPANIEGMAQVNRRLQALSELAQTAVIYLIDTTGTVIAASNWNRPRSFVGIRLDYRPYFQAAIGGQLGRYFALGTTSQERGYYFAAPIRQEEEKIVGVAVVKVGVERFETPATTGGDKIAVTDASGVVFVASDPAWQFKTLRPLDPQTRRRIEASRQYSDVVLAPLALAEDYLVQSVAMPGIGWKIHVFSDPAPVRRAVIFASVLTMLAFTIAVLAGLYLAQRRAVIREKLAAQASLRQAYDELENKVSARTAELRASNKRLQQEIMERKQAENELIQASKLAALGQLSAGIVHELNQPLAAIRSYADNGLAFLDRQRYDQARSNLVTIGELVERIAKITKHLKTFARKTPGEVEPVFLQRVIGYALSLIEPQIRDEAVELIQDFPKEDVPVWGESIRLEQVVVNLLKNALEAMRDQDRPRKLIIQLAVSSEHVRLTVRDAGPGIAEEHLGQLFDPFFTTKEIGDGLGLGLSISNKIIRDFGGSILAGNHEDGGAMFTITLVRADAALERLRGESTGVDIVTNTRRGSFQPLAPGPE